MASLEAISMMRERALARVVAALGGTLNTEGLDRDPGLAEAQLLERIADALDGGKKPEPEPEPMAEPMAEEEPKPSFSAGKPKGKRS